MALALPGTARLMTPNLCLHSDLCPELQATLQVHSNVSWTILRHLPPTPKPGPVLSPFILTLPLSCSSQKLKAILDCYFFPSQLAIKPGCNTS